MLLLLPLPRLLRCRARLAHSAGRQLLLVSPSGAHAWPGNALELLLMLLGESRERRFLLLHGDAAAVVVFGGFEGRDTLLDAQTVLLVSSARLIGNWGAVDTQKQLDRDDAEELGKNRNTHGLAAVATGSRFVSSKPANQAHTHPTQQSQGFAERVSGSLVSAPGLLCVLRAAKHPHNHSGCPCHYSLLDTTTQSRQHLCSVLFSSSSSALSLSPSLHCNSTRCSHSCAVYRQPTLSATPRQRLIVRSRLQQHTRTPLVFPIIIAWPVLCSPVAWCAANSPQRPDTGKTC